MHLKRIPILVLIILCIVSCKPKSVEKISKKERPNLLFIFTDLGLPLGVDVWVFSTDDGRSMRKAFDFLYPYAIGQMEWPYEEIGGVEKKINEEMMPLFAVASSIFQQDFKLN